MDWTDFAQRLTRELMHLPVDAFVIVQGPGGLPYVQAMRYLNGLHAEAVSSDYLPRPLDSGQELRLSELGWLAPDGRTRRNWWCRVMLPADAAAITPEQAAECGALADRMVAAFRDVYGVPSVAGLTYEANRNGENAGPVPMPGLGIPAADAEPAQAGPGLDWAEFTERLARELAAMEPEMVLVIPHRLQESHYVQAFRDVRLMRAEAVSGRALPPSAPRFDAREEERLATAGWRRPGEHPNWTCELPADAAPDEYRRLAAMMVTALRDVQLAHSPADLVYEAFIGAAHVELTEFGIPSAEPGRVDARRASPPLPDPPAARPAEPAEPAAPGRPVAGPAAAHAQAPSGPSADLDIEEELVAAKSRGDQPGYLGLVLRADLFVPVTEDGQPVTAAFRDGTYVLAYTSPEAMDWALGGKLMDYRRTTFTELARNWPRPDWQLAINSRLPSSAYIDTGTIQRTAERAGGRRPAPSGPPAPASPGGGVPAPRTAAPTADGSAPPRNEPVTGPATAQPDIPTTGTSPLPADRTSGPPADRPVAGAATAQTDIPARRTSDPPTDGPTAGATAPPADGPVAGAATVQTGAPTDRSSTSPADRPTADAATTHADLPADRTSEPPADKLTARAAVPQTGIPGDSPSDLSTGRPVTGVSASPPDELATGVPASPADRPAAEAATARTDVPPHRTSGPPTDRAAAEAASPQTGIPADRTSGPLTDRSAAGAAAPQTDVPADRASGPLTDGSVAGAAASRTGVPGDGTSGSFVDEPVGGASASSAGGPVGEAAASVPVAGAVAAASGVPAGPLEEGVVMQKVIRPDHVVHYLDGGYDWVAGRIHRLQDVSDLQTPGQLVRALGLGYEGSPFSPDDVEVFVIRWPVMKPAMVRADEPPAGSAVPAFRIGSQRLPHGAEMFGIDHLGTESFLAVYDADVRGWIRTGEAGG